MLNKGVDLIGWRTCKLQKEWGPKRFLLTLRKIGRQALEVAELPPPPANAGSLTPDQRKRLQMHQDTRQGAAQFQQGTPECPECPLSGGKPFGCHAFVDYPIDATFERALFTFFERTVAEEGTIAWSLYRDLISKIPAKETAWHTDRGPAGSLAELDQPMSKEWGFLMWKKHVDTAQIMGAVFFNQSRSALIAALAKFWDEFIEDARKTSDFGSSKTLQQFEHVRDLYDNASNAGSVADGISVLAEDDAAPLK